MSAKVTDRDLKQLADTINGRIADIFKECGGENPSESELREGLVIAVGSLRGTIEVINIWRGLASQPDTTESGK